MSFLQHAERCIANQNSHRALNAFVSLTKHELCRRAASEADARASQDGLRSDVDGRLIAIKDNICTTDHPTTCASNILKGYVSPYAATVVQRLQDAGAITAGKTNLDEFGMGSHSTHSIFGAVRNATGDRSGDPASAGGSSGGSAVAVASGQCWAALGTDTGGSVRLPAAYCGVVGFKPSYGLVSRHGVVAYANSLDTVGILAPESGVAKRVFEVLRGYDSKDPTSLSLETRRRVGECFGTRAGGDAPLRIGVPLEYNIAELQPAVRSAWSNVLHKLAGQGHAIRSVSLAATKLALSAYYVIAPAEASSNLARYDGVRYGNPSVAPEAKGGPLYSATRGEGFGEEVKRRILLGAYSLSAAAIGNYFIQAQRVRRLVQQDFDRVFAIGNPLLEPNGAVDRDAGVDVLLSPTAPSTAPRLSALAARPPVDTYRDDVLTVPASLAGVPAMSVPVHGLEADRDGAAIGLQIMAQFGDDETVFRAASIIEGLVP